jgi:cysteine desulfurase
MATAFYLDHNATAPLKPQARDAMIDWLSQTGNASSIHGFGRRARRAIESAREAVAGLVGADPANVIFTASGTEADNLALCGLPERAALVSAVEHPAVLKARGDALVIPVDSDGVIDLGALDAMLADAPPAIVSIMLANNETGVIQPVRAAAEIAHRHGALVHCDAVQGAGRLALDIAALGVDLMTISAHKMGGPVGAAALILAADIPLSPVLRGGGQERGRRAGTENVAAIAGFGVAARLAGDDLAMIERVRVRRDRLEAALQEVAPDCVVFGRDVARLANTSAIAMPGVDAETQLIACDLAGIAVSSGSACSSGRIAPSHVLSAMGVPPELARATIRVSIGPETTDEAIDRLIEVWTGLWRKRRNQPTLRAAV